MSKTGRVLPLIALAVCSVAGTQASAQAISGRALIATAWSSVRVDGVLERVDGFWPGAAVDVQMGPLTITASGTRGHLTSAIPFEPVERDVGEVSLSGRFELRSWLRFDVRYTERVFSSPPGRQRWDVLGVGLAVSRALGTPALRGYMGLAYLPLVSVDGTSDYHSGISGDVGIELAPLQLPLVMGAGYRIERFDFSGGVDRFEQFEAFTLSLGMRLRRLEGKWTLLQ